MGSTVGAVGTVGDGLRGGLPVAHVRVDRRAQRVHDDEVQLLHRRRRRALHRERVVARRRQGGLARAGERPRGEAELARRCAAATTFSLRPDVDSSSSTSPARPCAATCRAYISPTP
nr:hypothetical protein [Cellulosimicrobium sp. CUA-896]